jgi:hypothetical protein
MNTAGIDLTLNLNGSPAPASIVRLLKGAEVTLNDEGRSGFQIVFETSRADRSSTGYGLPSNSLLQPFTRVSMVLNFATVKTLLIDGMILHRQLQPGKSPNGALFTVTGEDVSVMMDITAVIKTFPGMDEGTIASTILGNYSAYASPSVTAPPVVIQPTATNYVPVQRGTDRAYLCELASRFGYRFYIKFGSDPSQNRAYWGPPEMSGSPQPSLLVDAGPLTNVISLDAFVDALTPMTVFAQVQDRETDQVSAISITSASSSLPTLSSNPILTTQSTVVNRIFEDGEGRLQTEAKAWAQGVVDQSTYDAVRLEGEVDPLRYGRALQPRSVVELAGAGSTFDGKYYVKRVTHVIERRSYRQGFTLTREGLN